MAPRGGEGEPVPVDVLISEPAAAFDALYCRRRAMEYADGGALLASARLIAEAREASASLPRRHRAVILAEAGGCGRRAR